MKFVILFTLFVGVCVAFPQSATNTAPNLANNPFSRFAESLAGVFGPGMDGFGRVVDAGMGALGSARDIGIDSLTRAGRMFDDFPQQTFGNDAFRRFAELGSEAVGNAARVPSQVPGEINKAVNQATGSVSGAASTAGQSGSETKPENSEDDSE